MTLIERLQAAQGPDRELDAEIYELIGIDEQHCKSWCRQDGRTDLTRAMFIRAWAPDLTASIDEAMTLVPEDSHFDISTHYSIANVYYYPDAAHGEGERYMGEASTAPIAICIAALRARGLE